MSLGTRAWWYAITETIRHTPPSLRRTRSAPERVRVRCVNPRLDPGLNWYEDVDDFLYDCEFVTGEVPQLIEAPDGWYTLSPLGEPELTLVPEPDETAR